VKNLYKSGLSGLLQAEPVQWAVDYLEELLAILNENSVNHRYGTSLLALEREELRQVWRKLSGGRDQHAGPVFTAYGLAGARLFVTRQLTCILPPVGLCRLHDSETVYKAVTARLESEMIFLRSFKLSLTEKPPLPSTVSRAVAMAAKAGLLGRLSLAGNRLHIYCLDYSLPAPAYYLYPTHSVLCGASALDSGEKLRCLLHEFGHVVHAGLAARRPPQADAALRRGEAERFAHRFAAIMLESGGRLPVSP
jgi:hypothetical protein